MTISVLIIAHNEEKYIAKCIESILNQTKKPEEILLVIHNSSDMTQSIAQKYAIKILEYKGPAGIIYSRIQGFNNIISDIILCIDGDSYAENNWVEEMVKTLQKGNILIGSWIKFKGTLYGSILSFFNKFLCKRQGRRAAAWIWGPSFAFWNKDKEKVIEIYQKTQHLSNQLLLSRNVEDYWLALYMSNEGQLEVTNKTYVCNHQKEQNSFEAIKRNKENVINASKIHSYFNSITSNK